jgi:hypothetical protein
MCARKTEQILGDAGNTASASNGTVLRHVRSQPLVVSDHQNTELKRAFGPDDPNYLDSSFWPVPVPGQSWIDARDEQLKAIDAYQGSIDETIALSVIPSDGQTSGKPVLRKDVYWPNFQISSPREDFGKLIPVSSPREDFGKLIPARPYCANVPANGIIQKWRPEALETKHIQFNPQVNYTWMLHDIDRRGAYLAHEEANLPPPNAIIINPANGHGHSACLLANPVAKHDMARYEPLKYFAAIERGYRRRLGADRGYQGFIAKNPLHSYWEVEWRRVEPYTLEELESYLFFADMAPDPSLRETMGAGRNVILFDELRGYAYTEVRHYKRQGRTQEQFRKRIEDVGLQLNQQFETYKSDGKGGKVNVGPLPPHEVRSIAKSVSRWTWKHFTEEKFRNVQSKRGIAGNKKRWGGHVSANKTKPWEALGMSRATYYRLGYNKMQRKVGS